MAYDLQAALNILAGTDNRDAQGAINDLLIQLGEMSLVDYLNARLPAVVTQAEYDALDPPDPDRLYVVIG